MLLAKSEGLESTKMLLDSDPVPYQGLCVYRSTGSVAVGGLRLYRRLRDAP